jgi:hypothetical protein
MSDCERIEHDDNDDDDASEDSESVLDVFFFSHVAYFDWLFNKRCKMGVADKDGTGVVAVGSVAHRKRFGDLCVELARCSYGTIGKFDDSIFFSWRVLAYFGHATRYREGNDVDKYIETGVVNSGDAS